MSKTRVLDPNLRNKAINDGGNNHNNGNNEPPQDPPNSDLPSNTGGNDKPPFLKWLITAVKVGVVLGILGVFAIVGFYLSVLYGAFGALPTHDELLSIKNPVASEVYAADGKLLGKYYTQNRSNVAFEDMPKHLSDALIATEDARFFQHKGVDTRSTFRVLIKTILLGDDSSGGGSTISQQVVKNLYGRERHGKLTMPVVKVKEMIIARRLEKVYSKKDILALYLNTVSFGERAFGIGTASQRFFNKPCEKLEVQESAALIGMLKAPTRYSPRRFPDRCLSRRNVVLDQMAKYEKISAVKALGLKKLPLGVNYNNRTTSEGLAPYFREYLRKELREWCKDNTKPDGSPYNLYNDGLKIYTTIDSRMQAHAEAAMESHMKALQSDFDEHWRKEGLPWGYDNSVVETAMKQSRRYKEMKAAGKSESAIKVAFRKNVKDMTIYTWDGEVKKTMSPRDSIIHYLKFLNAGFMAMEPQTGYIKAWVGGINHKYFKYDHLFAKRQVGSTFKPFVYAAAIEEGIEPCTYFENQLRTYIDEYDKSWTPGNSGDEYGGYYSMAGGLQKSMNTISVQVLFLAQVEKVIEMAKRLGITSEIPEVPSIALGTADISLFEMVRAYSVFPNEGRPVEPRYLLKIENSRGKTIKIFKRPAEYNLAMKPETAQIMTKMMESVVDSGTARRIRFRYNLNNDMAGKTGTTQKHTNGWFMGYTPKLVGGSWVGGSNNYVRFRTIGLGQGANTALPIWASFYKRLSEDSDFNAITRTEFKTLSDEVEMRMGCPNYKESLVKKVVEEQPVDNTNSGGIVPPPTRTTKNTNNNAFHKDKTKKGRTPVKPKPNKPKPNPVPQKPTKKKGKVRDWFKNVFGNK